MVKNACVLLKNRSEHRKMAGQNYLPEITVSEVDNQGKCFDGNCIRRRAKEKKKKKGARAIIKPITVVIRS